MESVISASMIVLSIRTHKSILHSKPSRALFLATIALVAKNKAPALYAADGVTRVPGIADGISVGAGSPCRTLHPLC